MTNYSTASITTQNYQSDLIANNEKATFLKLLGLTDDEQFHKPSRKPAYKCPSAYDDMLRGFSIDNSSQDSSPVYFSVL